MHGRSFCYDHRRKEVTHKMEWVDRMNRAMDYIEQNLCEELNNEQLGSIMACPYTAFTRSFAPITGMSLSEYKRRRR